ncbi:mitochondrial sulfite oxidase [Rhypophila decipiens]|uniref:Nitrate reductase [NADPH] n=1 Tax=Rhypophila decipiens TaxID=261697 RepID=A0AAN7BBT3_9PEZI|nr:mitochondrial sulfite oxidase [Rhypophila decipiens]
MMATRYPSGLLFSSLRRASKRPPITIYSTSPCRARPLHTTAVLRTPQPDASKTSRINNGSTRSARAAPISLLVGGGLLASAIAIAQSYNHDDDPHNHHLSGSNARILPNSNDNRDPSLPRFRLSSIRDEHGPTSPHPWVTYQDKVYDITDWIAAHPGGDVILRAAGGSIEPYWNIFSIHKAPHVREILYQYLIGYIDVLDLDENGKPALETIEDPFQADPVRDPRFIVHTDKPRNAEPPNEELLREFRTSNEMFYIRNHMWVPVVDEKKADEEYALTVELPDGETKRYTLGELKAKFPTHKVTAVLQCSGNRRNDMTRHAGKTNGLQWGVGAIGNAEWEGVRLADVLADAGLVVSDPRVATRKSSQANNGEEDPRLMHVQFSGLEAYGASIPLSKALDPMGDVILAYGMNGKTLPRDHGFPLRAIVPGNVAARSVKWLSKIVIADEESTSQWQRRDYKSFGPNEGANPDWDRSKSIQEMPVTSAITGVWVGECVRKGKAPSWANNRQNGRGVVDVAAVERVIGYTPPPDPTSTTIPCKPCPDQTPPAEPVAIQGYAYSGGGRAIARVDVSLDGGKTWDQAELVDDCSPNAPESNNTNCHGNKNWSWTRWRYTGQLPVIPIPPSTLSQGGEQQDKKFCTTLVVKATDEAYNSQPETHKGIYNVRGNLATAWHRVRICPSCVVEENQAEGKAGGVRWSTGETYGCGFGKETVAAATPPAVDEK